MMRSSSTKMLNDLKVQCNALEASGISFIFIYKHGGKIHSFGKKEARNVIDSVITKLDFGLKMYLRGLQMYFVPNVLENNFLAFHS